MPWRPLQSPQVTPHAGRHRGARLPYPIDSPLRKQSGRNSRPPLPFRASRPGRGPAAPSPRPSPTRSPLTVNTKAVRETKPGTRGRSARGSGEPATRRPSAAALRRAAEGSARRVSGPRCPGRSRREHPPPPPAPPLAHCARRRRHRRPPRAAGAGCPRSQLALVRSLRATANRLRRRGRRLPDRPPKARRLLTNSPPKAAPAVAAAAAAAKVSAASGPEAAQATPPRPSASPVAARASAALAAPSSQSPGDRTGPSRPAPDSSPSSRPPPRPARVRSPKVTPSPAVAPILLQLPPSFSPCTTGHAPNLSGYHWPPTRISARTRDPRTQGTHP